MVMGGLIYELKCLIRSSFISCHVRFAPRTCNNVAHAVAAMVVISIFLMPTLLWDGTPQDVENLVASDIADSIIIF